MAQPINPRDLVLLSAKVAQALSQANKSLVTAESCSGGGIAYYLTEIAGSSSWFERGFVTYSNQAKQDMLDVDVDTLNQRSEEHTSELQSRLHLVCRLLLEKKNYKTTNNQHCIHRQSKQ